MGSNESFQVVYIGCFGRWRETVPLENVSHRLIEPVIRSYPPAGVLPGNAHDERLDGRSTRGVRRRQATQ
jgi:hypothetical protein